MQKNLDKLQKMLEKYMKHSDKLQKMQKKCQKNIFIKIYCKKLQEMHENVRKVYENLRKIVENAENFRKYQKSL